MDFWLDLFTGRTWGGFVETGGHISGFRDRRKYRVNQIKKGDILLCYLTGIRRWVGALEVVGPTKDIKNLPYLDDFPIQLEVRPIILLKPEYGVSLASIYDKVSFDPKYFSGFVRGSPSKFKQQKDGNSILNLLKNAEKNPISQPVSKKLLERIPLYKAFQKDKGSEIQKMVSVPDEDVPSTSVINLVETESQYSTDHVLIQYTLLTIGAEMGLDVWVARNDRSKEYSGKTLGSLPRMIETLPTQFNDATQKTIELIDVLWLKGNAIIAAFEIETTTSIYSGLLRMSDLLSLQPNIGIKIYLIAPDERQNRVQREILRPTFEMREKPLSEICTFLPLSALKSTIAGIQQLGVTSSIKPDFLDKIAINFASKKDGI